MGFAGAAEVAPATRSTTSPVRRVVRDDAGLARYPERLCRVPVPPTLRPTRRPDLAARTAAARAKNFRHGRSGSVRWPLRVRGSRPHAVHRTGPGRAEVWLASSRCTRCDGGAAAHMGRAKVTAVATASGKRRTRTEAPPATARAAAAWAGTSAAREPAASGGCCGTVHGCDGWRVVASGDGVGAGQGQRSAGRSAQRRRRFTRGSCSMRGRASRIAVARSCGW